MVNVAMIEVIFDGKYTETDRSQMKGNRFVMKLKFTEPREYLIGDDPVYEGYCSKLYKGIDLRLNRRSVAVKIVEKPKDWKMSDLEDEIITCCRVGNLTSQVPMIYDYKKQGDTLYIVMQWVNGKDLSAVLKQGRGAYQKLQYAKELCGILKSLHRSSLHYQHRDLKPDNIRIADDGRVFLMDFNITASARHIGEGTNAYRPPENDENYALQGYDRIDVFQLGVIFYEMFTGHRPEPFVDYSADYSDTVWAEFKEPKEWKTNLSSRLNQIIVRCMKMNPEDRYADAGCILDDLNRLRGKIYE